MKTLAPRQERVGLGTRIGLEVYRRDARFLEPKENLLNMVRVAKMVDAPDCGSGSREICGFNSRLSPHKHCSTDLEIDNSSSIRLPSLLAVRSTGLKNRRVVVRLH